MTFIFFITSLISLCVASIASFISAFTKKPLLLAIFVPLITICGSAIYFSYTSVLGYSVNMDWEQLPDKFTVIYFKVEDKTSIHLWLLEKRKTRLVTVPYMETAEDAMEGERKTMGQGTPVTFGKEKISGKSGNRNRQRSPDGNGQGKKRRPSWRYKVLSKGDPIPGTALRPKEQP
jgi:hypothetical protein